MSSQTIRPAAHTRRQWLLLAITAVLLFSVSFLIGTRLFASATTPPAPAVNTAAAGVGIVDPPHLLADFTLTSQTGDPISLSDLRGKAVLMFFGYTHCPDVCPGTLAEYRDVKRRLGPAAEDVEFVFISVDGVRDTPQRLTEYLALFDSDFIGMTGDEATLRALGNEYGLFFEQDAPAARNVAAEESGDHAHDSHGDDHEHGHESETLADHVHEDDMLDQQNYFVQHTSPSFLVDADGYLRTVFFFGTAPGVVADGVQAILEDAA